MRLVLRWLDFDGSPGPREGGLCDYLALDVKPRVSPRQATDGYPRLIIGLMDGTTPRWRQGLAERGLGAAAYADVREGRGRLAVHQQARKRMPGIATIKETP